MEKALRTVSLFLHYWVIALPALLCVFFVPLPFVTIAQSKMLLVIVTLVLGFACFLFERGMDGFIRIPKSWILALSALVPLAYLASALNLSSAMSFFGNGSDLDTVAALFFVYLLAVLSAFILRTERTGDLFVKMIMFAGIGAAIIYVLQIFFSTNILSGIVPPVIQSSVGSWHDLAILSGLCFSLVILALPHVRDTVARAVWLGACVLLGVVLVVLGAVDVWLGIALFLLVSVLIEGSSLYRVQPHLVSILKKSAWTISFAVAALLCAIFATSIHALLPARIQLDNVEVRPSWQGTYEVSQQVFKNTEALFLGSGPNTFAHQWGMYKPLSVNATQFWNADFPFGVGFVPTSAVTVGVIGLVAWVIVLCALVGALYHVFKRGLSLQNPRVLVLLSALYLAVFLAAYTPSLAIVAVFFLCVGVVASLTAPESFVIPLSRVARASPIAWTASVFLLVLLLVVAFQTTRILASNILVNKSVVQFSATQNIAGASTLISRALALYSANDRAHRSAIELGFIQLQQEAQTNPANTTGLKTILDTTISHGLSAVAADPRKYENWLVLAQFYRSIAGAGVDGADAQARIAFEKAFEAQPRNPYPLLALAEMDIAANDATSTRAHVEQALAIKPNLAAGRYMLSRLNAAEGRMQEALDEGIATTQLAPNDALAWFNVGSLLYLGADYPTAVQALERAVALQADYSDALFILGLSYGKMGQKNDALAVFKKVLELNPGNATVLQAIASIQAAQKSQR